MPTITHRPLALSLPQATPRPPTRHSTRRKGRCGQATCRERRPLSGSRGEGAHHVGVRLWGGGCHHLGRGSPRERTYERSCQGRSIELGESHREGAHRHPGGAYGQGRQKSCTREMRTGVLCTRGIKSGGVLVGGGSRDKRAHEKYSNGDVRAWTRSPGTRTVGGFEGPLKFEGSSRGPTRPFVFFCLKPQI